MRAVFTQDYPQPLAHWVHFPHPTSLSPGRPSAEAKTILKLTLEEAFTGLKIVSRTDAQACLAGLLLRLDFLEQSHHISQGVLSNTGSFWHAIMHRREPDFGNSKYWFRQVGQHPVLSELCRDAAELGFANYDPFVFVDAVEAGDNQPLLKAVQEREWALLFDYSFREATGAG